MQGSKRRSFSLGGLTVVSILTAGLAAQAQTLTPLGTFGGGDGWRAPNEILTGDTAGTATGSNYNYLSNTSLERGLAFNPVTGNLIVVSRSAAGNGIRLLNGQTGVDVGSLNQGSGIITGGTFTTNMVGVANDGTIYVNNLNTNVATGAYKVYQWTSEGAAVPTTYFNSTLTGFSTGTARLGDTFDVFGSGAGTTLVSGASGVMGYATMTGAVTGTATVVSPITGTANGDFRLGTTFGATANDVWGKQTAAQLRRTTYSGSAGTLVGSNTMTVNGEMAMDFISFGASSYLATIDNVTSTVRVYNATNPGALSLVASATTTSGALTANGNGVGSVKFGALNPDGSINLYAMSTNQGIQAFLFGVAIPEPGTIALLALSVPGIALLLRRRTSA